MTTNMTWMRCAAVSGALLLATPDFADAQKSGSPENAAVISTVERFFNAMARRDTAALRGLLLPGSELIATTTTDTGTTMRRTKDTSFVASMGRGKDRLLERFWTPTVLIRGGVALVWTPYDFHLNGTFSHCGVDTFSLVRAPAGWQIASITYTVERKNCEPSPLGPPT